LILFFFLKDEKKIKVNNNGLGDFDHGTRHAGVSSAGEPVGDFFKTRAVFRKDKSDRTGLSLSGQEGTDFFDWRFSHTETGIRGRV